MIRLGAFNRDYFMNSDEEKRSNSKRNSSHKSSLIDPCSQSKFGYFLRFKFLPTVCTRVHEKLKCEILSDYQIVTAYFAGRKVATWQRI